MKKKTQKFPLLDLSKIELHPLSERRHELDVTNIREICSQPDVPDPLFEIARRIVSAQQQGRPVVLMMGAHVIRSGVQRYLIDLMENGFITCIATNGACVIHDYEFSLIGKTTENVENYIQDGRFGFWHETGRINDIVARAAQEEIGLGEAVGQSICSEEFPYRDISIFAAGHRLGVLLTVHVGIGYDIIHQHPNFSGAAYGDASHTDFLRFARVLEHLKGGVVLVFGSSVMAPEVFLKALSMARNVARQKGKEINSFVTLVCDLQKLPDDFSAGATKEDPGYYFRPWKTLLIRTVADGGESFYVQGAHSQTIPALWTAIKRHKEQS